MRKLTLTEKSLESLKCKYDKAIKAKLEQFKFQGGFLVTSYAKYLIEYAENEFNNSSDNQ